MQAMWKWQLQSGENVVEMPKGAKVLSVIEQHGVPTLYALIDPNEQPERRVFYVAMTGQPIEFVEYGGVGLTEDPKFIGTVRDPGNYVAHVFEIVPAEGLVSVGSSMSGSASVMSIDPAQN